MQGRKKQNYPNIDMKRTGIKLKKLLVSAGYTPKMIQEYLHLSCVQPIYRWYKGIILPSVDHLLMLSELLGVHMEELLVKKQEKVWDYKNVERYLDNSQKRLVMYLEKVCEMMV